MPVVPKKRITQFLTRRRRLLFYLDHYRHLFKHRREHFDRRKYQESMYMEDYVTPTFRFAGFWPGKFGFHQSQDQYPQRGLEGTAASSITDGKDDGNVSTGWRPWNKR
ncbi:unnamed protein product [Polarella glacialis]|uniref:Uncharacterized protein n=1 Tax=Polarella glacialis TaxID=89957 RepID=A0A813KW74_POLGL|nr:unnamed protein product [Polarella glacialis]|mmetsp:Transcript_54083/g.87410  ORF Transcript_54083/g.87410 Transcript_54083/m.87410 type:complete len:108 (-) Transcript_54083:60-383(-)